MPSTYPPTEATRLCRRTHHGHHAAATVHVILDEDGVAHVGDLDGGQPVVTPPAYRREGDWLY